MASLNRATIMGHLGKDPEMRYTAGGMGVASFSIATSETWKDKAGNKQERTTWHNIEAWGKLAEIVEKYLVKGTPIYLEGRIGNQEWTGKDGGKRSKTVITADKLLMLGGGNKGSGQGKSSAEDHGPADDDFIPEIDEDDVPL